MCGLLKLSKALQCQVDDQTVWSALKPLRKSTVKCFEHENTLHTPASGPQGLHGYSLCVCVCVCVCVPMCANCLLYSYESYNFHNC